MHYLKMRSGFIFVMGMFLLNTLAVMPANAKVPSMAVFPLKVNSDLNLSYIQSAVVDMLASRLAASGKLTVVDKSHIETALKSLPEGTDRNNVEQISALVDADYILVGTLTELGNRIRLDLQLTPVLDREHASEFFAHCEKKSDLIPNIDLLTDDIYKKIFGNQIRQKPEVSIKPSPKIFDMHTHPEKLLMENGTADE